MNDNKTGQTALSILSTKENTVIEVTYSFLMLTGYKKDDFIGKSIEEVFDLLHFDHSNKLSDPIYIFTNNLEPIEIKLLSQKTSSGVTEYVFDSPSRVMDKFPYINNMYSDSEDLGAAVFSSNNFILLQANRAYLDVFPSPFNSIAGALGQPITKIFPYFVNNVLREAFQESIEKKKPIKTEEISLDFDIEKYVKFFITPYFENNDIKYFTVLVNNNTKEILKLRELKTKQETDLNIEKREKEALEQAMRLKDDFLTIISHELKTPLTVIMSAVQAMEILFRDELSEKAIGYLHKIRQNTLRQLRMVNNILDLTRMESGTMCISMQNFDVISLTQNIVDSVRHYAKQRGITIHYNSESDNLIMGVDAEKYERIVLNLLSNAIKFTPRGKMIYVDIYKKIHYVHIRVRDEGVGIPRDKLNLIFERFGQVDRSLTRRAEGTGIGLTLVKLLANGMGGDIEVDSLEGEGSSFTLVLPIFRTGEELVQKEFDSILLQTVASELSDISFKDYDKKDF